MEKSIHHDSSGTDTYYGAVSSFAEPDDDYDFLFDQLGWAICVLFAIMLYIYMSWPELDDDSDDHKNGSNSSSTMMTESGGGDNPFHGRESKFKHLLVIRSTSAENRGKAECEDPEVTSKILNYFAPRPGGRRLVLLNPDHETDYVTYEEASMSSFCPESSGGKDFAVKDLEVKTTDTETNHEDSESEVYNESEDNPGKAECAEPAAPYGVVNEHLRQPRGVRLVELFPDNEPDDFIYDEAFMPRYCPEPSVEHRRRRTWRRRLRRWMRSMRRCFCCSSQTTEDP